MKTYVVACSDTDHLIGPFDSRDAAIDHINTSEMPWGDSGMILCQASHRVIEVQSVDDD